MPLTKTGKKILSEMREKYGRKKGKNVFYAWINKMVKLGKFARSRFEKGG